MGRWVTINGAHIYINEYVEDNEPIGDSGQLWEGDITPKIPKTSVGGITDKEVEAFERRKISGVKAEKLRELRQNIKEAYDKATSTNHKKRLNQLLNDIDEELGR